MVWINFCHTLKITQWQSLVNIHNIYPRMSSIMVDVWGYIIFMMIVIIMWRLRQTRVLLKNLIISGLTLCGLPLLKTERHPKQPETYEGYSLIGSLSCFLCSFIGSLFIGEVTNTNQREYVMALWKHAVHFALWPWCHCFTSLLSRPKNVNKTKDSVVF